MPNWLITILTVLVQAILKRCTPMIVEKVEDFLLELEKRAKETPNVFDDMFVDLLKTVFKVD